MSLPPELLEKWSRYSEKQIARAGPGALLFFKEIVKPELEQYKDVEGKGDGRKNRGKA